MGQVIAFPTHRAKVAAAQQGRPDPAAHTPSGTVPVDRSSSTAPVHPAPLWRVVVGEVLRTERQRQRRTLAQVAARAGMSEQYLSELERGRKEASSEMLAAACGALGIGLGDFARRCADAFAPVVARPTGPVLSAA